MSWIFDTLESYSSGNVSIQQFQVDTARSIRSVNVQQHNRYVVLCHAWIKHPQFRNPGHMHNMHMHVIVVGNLHSKLPPNSNGPKRGVVFSQ